MTAAAPFAHAQEGEAPQSHTHDVRTGLTLEGGIVGVQTLNLPNNPGPMVGVHVGLGYNTRQFGILADAATARAHDGTLTTYNALALGGRWYILDGAFSPYLGAGVAWTSLWTARPGDTFVVTAAGGTNHVPFEGSGDGADLYAEIGLLAFRTQAAPRINVGVRADLPLYKVTSFDPLATASNARYVPVSLMVSIVF